MMVGGIGPLLSLTRGAQYTLGAIVFTGRAAPPPGRDPNWMQWGTLLVLHSDLADADYEMWMGNHFGDMTFGEWAIPPWLSESTLRAQTCSRVFAEAARRREALHAAEYTLEHRQLMLSVEKIRGDRGRRIVRRARDELIEAQDQAWPKLDGHMLGRCADAMLAEIRKDERCGDCGASGVMPYVVDDRRQEIKCPACHGTGIEHHSDRARADLLGVAWSTYRRAWKRPHDWLCQEAFTARREAVRHLREQLAE